MLMDILLLKINKNVKLEEREQEKILNLEVQKTIKTSLSNCHLCIGGIFRDKI